MLTQRNAFGNPVAQWVLGTVFLTSDAIAGGGSAVPTETLHMLFGSVAEATAGHTASWDQSQNAIADPTPPTGVTLAPLPSVSAPALTLDLQPSGPGLPAVTLGLGSYQFGFENPTTIGSATTGAGAGKARFDDLIVTAPLSDASPQLFSTLVTGRHYETAVLTQRNAAGDLVAQWVLGVVFLSSDGIAGSGAVVPTETLHVVFGSVSEATAGNAQSWSALTNSTSDAPSPTGVTLAPLPAILAPALTLDLQPSPVFGLPAMTLNLDSYQFGFENPTTIGSATGGAGAGKAKFDDLIVSARLSDASPQLLKALVIGGHFPTAVLTQRNAAGNPVAQWILSTVFLNADGITGSGSAVPTETLHMVFGSVNEATAGHSISWNQAENRDGDPTPPTGVTLAPLPPASAPAVTLELQPADASLPAITLALTSYQFGFENPTTIGSATSGAGAGKAKFNDLTVSGLLSDLSPQLLKTLVTGGHFTSGVLTQRNSAGSPVAQWVLGTLFLSSDVLTSDVTHPDALPTEALKLPFGSVTEVTAGHSSSWDQVSNSNGVPASTGVALSPLPAVTAPAMTLDLQPESALGLPPVTLALNSYEFGFENPTSIGSATSGAGAGKVKFDDLIVSELLSDASPQLFRAMVVGGHFTNAVLTQRNAAGNPVAQWVLDTVFISSDAIAGNGPAVPTETLHLLFGKVTEVTANHTTSWDQVQNVNAGPTPTGVALAPLGVSTPTVSITDNGGVYNGATFVVTAATVQHGRHHAGQSRRSFAELHVLCRVNCDGHWLGDGSHECWRLYSGRTFQQHRSKPLYRRRQRHPSCSQSPPRH